MKSALKIWRLLLGYFNFSFHHQKKIKKHIHLPESFKREILAEFPNDLRLQQLIKENDVSSIGMIMLGYTMTPTHHLPDPKAGNYLENLAAFEQKIARRQELYNKFYKLCSR